ncbi:MAG: hypothetical protein AABN33_18195 [Acidobacteriota bacterium]
MNKSRKKRGVYDEEIARTVAILESLPIELLPWLTASQLINAYEIKLSRNTVKPIIAGKKAEGGKQKAAQRPEDIEARIVIERLARVMTKTYAYCGDAELIGTEDAQRMMLRELRKYDPSILARNEKRKATNA